MFQRTDGGSVWIRQVPLIIGLAAFLMLCTINGFVTSELARGVVVILRPLLSLALLVACCIVFFMQERKAPVAWSSGAFLSLCGAGYALALWNGVSDTGLWPLMLGALIGTMGGALLLSAEGDAAFRALMPGFLCYALIGFALVVALGGFTFSHPARFIFEAFTAQVGVPVLYSQATSKLFGLAALAAASISVGSCSLRAALSGLSITLGFLVLSLLAAARGESAVAVLMVVMVFLAYRPLMFLAYISVLSILLWGLVDDWSWVNDFLIVRRWGVAFPSNVPADVAAGAMQGLSDGSMLGGGGGGLMAGGGVRGNLLSWSWDLLASRPDCLWHGCGFGFFQSFRGLEYGYYPHNQAVEMVITFGLPFTVVMALLVGHGFLKYIRLNGVRDPLLLFFTYTLVNCLKSGALFTDAFLVAGFLFFIVWGFCPVSGHSVAKLNKA